MALFVLFFIFFTIFTFWVDLLCYVVMHKLQEIVFLFSRQLYPFHFH